MVFDLFQKIKEANSKATTYRVGLLQTKAYRALKNHTSAVLVGYDISAADWALLGILFEETNGLRFIELAEILAVEAPFVTAMIDDLEKKGLVSRTSDPKDKRAKIVTLTEKGKTFVPAVEKVLRNNTKNLLKDIPLRELYTYLKVLNKIVKNTENK